MFQKWEGDQKGECKDEYDQNVLNTYIKLLQNKINF